MTGFLVAAVVIAAIVCLLVAYAIKVLKSKPMRVVAVITAITALVVALPKVFDALRPPAAPANIQAPAQASPAPTSSSAVSPPESASPSGSASPTGSASGTAASDAAGLPAAYPYPSAGAGVVRWA